jgi:S-adenosylmethionine:tRNA ribosyltransferase-isomerase
MLTSDFDYSLPREFIAQTPVEPRDSSRLMVLNRNNDFISHSCFLRLGNFLNSGDVLVLNESKVIPARLFGKKIPGGGRVELLFLRQLTGLEWEAWVGGKGLIPGIHLEMEGGLQAEVRADLGGARRKILCDRQLLPHLDQYGHPPLPPYIHSELVNPERYQTVYAEPSGSAAAPTAGLHFTEELIARLEDQGVCFARIVLHVGLDTFAPVNEKDPGSHRIHSEWCSLSQEAANTINQAQKNNGRVIAVGTTSVRTLETAARSAESGHIVAPFSGNTDLFILPGFQFLAVDAMITNFHLPKSTLIMLVSAFAGREKILGAYQIAVQEKYRFYSFGDAMLIL